MATYTKGSGLGSAKRGATITADTEINPTRALWIGTGGDLDVEFPDNSQASLTNVGDGVLLPLAVVKVLGTSTASDIIALY